MADQKVTELPAGSAPTGAEVIYIVQGGASRRITIDELLALAHSHTVDNLDSSGASLGDVPTADGSGGTAWGPQSGGGSSGPVAPTVLAANYTIVTADHGKAFLYTGASSITLTLDDACPDGFMCDVINAGTGTIVFATEGTDTLTPAGLTLDNSGSSALTVASILHNAGAWYGVSGERVTEAWAFALSDETSNLTTGTKLAYPWPYNFVVTGIIATVNTAPTGATITVDMNAAGVSLLSTKLTIDASEKTSETAAVAPVFSGTSIAKGAEVTFDIDQVGSTVAGAGLKVTVLGYRL